MQCLGALGKLLWHADGNLVHVCRLLYLTRKQCSFQTDFVKFSFGIVLLKFNGAFCV